MIGWPIFGNLLGLYNVNFWNSVDFAGYLSVNSPAPELFLLRLTITLTLTLTLPLSWTLAVNSGAGELTDKYPAYRNSVIFLLYAWTKAESSARMA